jgi:hypothetical protein
MENKSTSKNRTDYEILIRKRGEGEYTSYCPQLNLLIKGTQHEEVAGLMEEAVAKHISELPE